MWGLLQGGAADAAGEGAGGGQLQMQQRTVPPRYTSGDLMHPELQFWPAIQWHGKGF